jgi:hypothetical protein
MTYIKIIFLIILYFGSLQSQDFQWDNPIKISNNPKGWCGRPTICNDSEGNLYVAFNHYNLRDSKRLYFNWFDGENWHGVDTLYQHDNYDVYDTKLVCDNKNNLHLSIEIAYGEYGRIYYMKREDNNWSDLIQISIDSLGNTWDHDMVVDNNGKVYFFFHVNDIYYRTYYDSSLSDPINVTYLDLGNYTAFTPKVEINSENNIFLTYRVRDDNDGVTDVYYCQFNGSVWSDPVNISHFTNLPSLYQDLVIDAHSNSHVVWEQRLTKLDTVLGNPTTVSYYEIFYTTNKGGTWLTPEKISNIPKSSSFRPKIDIYKEKPLVFFETFYDDTSEHDKYHSFKINDDWLVNKWDVDFNTLEIFDFIIDSSDIIHIATSSLPISQRADMEYVKGYINSTSISPTIEYPPSGVPLANYPNPFNNETKIQFLLDKPNIIDIQIFDVTGKLVKSILKEQLLSTGIHSYTWNSTNNQGHNISSGVYFLLLTQGNKRIHKHKILLLK